MGLEHVWNMSRNRQERVAAAEIACSMEGSRKSTVPLVGGTWALNLARRSRCPTIFYTKSVLPPGVLVVEM